MMDLTLPLRLKGYRFPRSVIAYMVWSYYRFNLSLRDVEDLLAARGVTVSYETIRVWVDRFGPQIACGKTRESILKRLSGVACRPAPGVAGPEQCATKRRKGGNCLASPKSVVVGSRILPSRASRIRLPWEVLTVLISETAQ